MTIGRPFGGGVFCGCVAVLWCCALAAQTVPDIGPINIDGVPGERARLGERLSQSALVALSRRQQIAHGRRIFSTPFNSLDGLGDGPTALL